MCVAPLSFSKAADAPSLLGSRPISDVNHACIPNAVHHSVASQGGLKLLVAACAIETGEEIAHSYVSLDGECKLASRGQKIGPFLKRTWGFDCTCTACKDDALRAKLDRMLELSIAIVACTPQTTPLW